VGAQELSVAAVCARVAKKILPFEGEEPQTDLQKVEIFFKPLACPCTHVLCTKRAIDEHLITCSVGSWGRCGEGAVKNWLWMGSGENAGGRGCGLRYGYRWEQVEDWDVSDDRTTGGSRLKVGMSVMTGLPVGAG